MSAVFSTPAQLERIKVVLSRYLRLPFSSDSVPGALLEGVLAHVRNAERLNTYDFVDVVDQKAHVGWQIKSTKESTPVTWKRAKIPNKEVLVAESRKSSRGVQDLGNAIIDFCNAHAAESISRYKLEEIGYARLILSDGLVRYFERPLCTSRKPRIFEPSDFSWAWSIQKKTEKKEQLSAFHGVHIKSGTKWFAWHGLGENQLHFSGEKAWWPPKDSPHAVAFQFPTDKERISLDGLVTMLERL